MTQLTPAVTERIISAVRRGARPRQAAVAAGISAATLDEWLRLARTPDATYRNGYVVADNTRQLVVSFAERLAQAQAECMQELENQLFANAITPDKFGRGDTQAIREILSKHPGSRSDWFEQKQLNVDSVVTHRTEDQLTASADVAQLEAWANLALPDATKNPED